MKINEKGEIEKSKARVVAKGYSQVEGVNYDHTFSPTVIFESIRQMVALGASKGMQMHQMDVTTWSNQKVQCFREARERL